MYNAQIPSDVMLPTSKQLIKSTGIAIAVAAVLLVGVVLPSEYGIDPIGTGKLLGLKEMGEIKTQLAKEAEADRQKDVGTAVSEPIQNKAASVQSIPSQTISNQATRQDNMSVTLSPGEGAELKMVMEKGNLAKYNFTVKDGVVNYDLHGDGGGENISYKKGRELNGETGEIVAAFTGNHGWFFRNRGNSPIVVTLETNGNYRELKRVK